MRQIYAIVGMHCAACVSKVQQALQAMVPMVRVSLHPPQAVVEGDRIPSLADLNQSLAAVGAYRLELMPEEVTPESPPAPPNAELAADATTVPGGWSTYAPLLIIIGLIAVVSLRGAGSLHDWMLHFMAGFFLVFGAFKLLDLRGFHQAYAEYDLLARRWPVYGLAYPFVQLTLGLAFLFELAVQPALWLSLLLMLVSGLGVFVALRRGRRIRCACLGTALKLHMSSVTLVEDLGMAAMAILMLL